MNMKLIVSLIILFSMASVNLYSQECQTVKKENYVFSTSESETIRYKFPTHINDLVMDRSEARFSEVFFVVIDPGKAPPLHKHDDTEQLFYVTEGSGMLTIGDENPEKFKVAAGDLVRIPVGAWHSIEADASGTMKYLAIDCFGGIRNEDEPTWDSHVRVLCKEQGWDYNTVIKK